jgi:hypothetical protein
LNFSAIVSSNGEYEKNPGGMQVILCTKIAIDLKLLRPRSAFGSRTERLPFSNVSHHSDGQFLAKSSRRTENLSRIDEK